MPMLDRIAGLHAEALARDRGRNRTALRREREADYNRDYPVTRNHERQTAFAVSVAAQVADRVPAGGTQSA
jgi:hypothetical protein